VGGEKKGSGDRMENYRRNPKVGISKSQSSERVPSRGGKSDLAKNGKKEKSGRWKGKRLVRGLQDGGGLRVGGPGEANRGNSSLAIGIVRGKSGVFVKIEKSKRKKEGHVERSTKRKALDIANR